MIELPRIEMPRPFSHEAGRGLAPRGARPQPPQWKLPRSTEIRALHIYLCSVCSTVDQEKKNIKWGQNEIGERENRTMFRPNIVMWKEESQWWIWSVYIYIYNKLPNFNKPTLLGGGREYGERSLIYPKMRFETCSSPYLIYLYNLNSFGKNISYYYSLSLEPWYRQLVFFAITLLWTDPAWGL